MRALLLAAALGVAACTPVVEHHGHLIEPEDLDAIRPGVSTRLDVARLLGSPSTLSTFEDDRWIYIAQKTERASFYQEKITRQDVLAIDFDESGFVTDLERVDLASAAAIDPAEPTTPTAGNELTLVQQLIGNIGRFNPSSLGDDRTTRPGSAARR